MLDWLNGALLSSLCWWKLKLMYAMLQDRARIVENVCQVVPSLRGAKVVQEWGGLRPYREPVRLELQHFKVRLGQGMP